MSVIALLIADIHLSQKAPVARSSEGDWYVAMERYLKQVRELKRINGDCAILCAGDIFDKWNAPPEVINFALDKLPDDMICIPGQHDLPLHNIGDISKSAYWTLKKVGKIIHIGTGMKVSIPDFVVWGFPYGSQVVQYEGKDSRVKIAMVHDYCWIQGSDYPGAPKEKRLGYRSKSLAGYDVSVFGDNHKGFSVGPVFNCGALIPRSSDESNYRPRVGMLHDDGVVITHTLDTTEDCWLVDDSSLRQEQEDDVGLKNLVTELNELEQSTLDFRQAMKRYLAGKIEEDVKKVLLEVMGE
jgi:DNA repair exonuclease SbcCD nuclease subunit